METRNFPVELLLRDGDLVNSGQYFGFRYILCEAGLGKGAVKQETNDHQKQNLQKTCSSVH